MIAAPQHFNPDALRCSEKLFARALSRCFSTTTDSGTPRCRQRKPSTPAVADSGALHDLMEARRERRLPRLQKKMANRQVPQQDRREGLSELISQRYERGHHENPRSPEHSDQSPQPPSSPWRQSGNPRHVEDVTAGVVGPRSPRLLVVIRGETQKAPVTTTPGKKNDSRLVRFGTDQHEGCSPRNEVNMSDAQDRGRHADRPQDIPKPGWRDILLRVKDELTVDHVSVVSAGVAFFGLLAVFPAIAALISIAGLLLDPAAIEAQLEAAASALPQNAAAILQNQAQKVASNAGTGVGLAAIFGILVSLYSASKGMKTLMEGMNIAYDEDEERGFLSLNVTALALTLFLIVGVLIALAFTLVAPALLGSLGLSDTAQVLVTYGRWPILAILTTLGLAVLYRYGPSREDPQWQWVSVGAVVATIVWIVGSVAFSIYVRNFGSYNDTYGALGGVIILLTWLWLSAFIVLLGAELNSEMEHQTTRDTTTGPERPRGQRGAAKADTVGRTP